MHKRVFEQFSAMSGKRRASLAKAFVHFSNTYMMGYIRILSSEVVTGAVRVALLRSKADKADTSPIAIDLRAIQDRDISRFFYVNGAAHLIYTMTLFDTFLTETTRFFLLLFPEFLSEEGSITIDDLLSAKSRNEIVSAAVDKKCRQVAFNSFIDRISYLENNFIGKLRLSEAERDTLDRCSHLRNNIVHDQGVFRAERTNSGSIKVRPKTCFEHPTQFKEEDQKKAEEAVGKIVFKVSKAVIENTLKAKGHYKYLEVLNVLNEGHEGIPAPNLPLEPTAAPKESK